LLSPISYNYISNPSPSRPHPFQPSISSVPRRHRHSPHQQTNERLLQTGTPTSFRGSQPRGRRRLPKHLWSPVHPNHLRRNHQTRPRPPCARLNSRSPSASAHPPISAAWMSCTRSTASTHSAVKPIRLLLPRGLPGRPRQHDAPPQAPPLPLCVPAAREHDVQHQTRGLHSTFSAAGIGPALAGKVGKR
jgi:hypothetical protein